MRLCSVFRYIPSASRRNRARDGATAVEMALLAPWFFLLMIGIVEMCLIFAAQQLLESAAFNASRLAKTGYTATGQTQTQTVNQILDQELQSFGTFFTIGNVQMTSTSYSSFSGIGQTGQGTAGMGSAQQIVVYTITYPWKLFTPMIGQLIGTWDPVSQSWIVKLTSRIVVRNEPYS